MDKLFFMPAKVCLGTLVSSSVSADDSLRWKMKKCLVPFFPVIQNVINGQSDKLVMQEKTYAVPRNEKGNAD